jgi:hypothetical protein
MKKRGLKLILAMGLLLAGGCSTPLVHKEYHTTINQYGMNTVTSDILKKETFEDIKTDLSNQYKASLK